MKKIIKGLVAIVLVLTIVVGNIGDTWNNHQNLKANYDTKQIVKMAQTKVSKEFINRYVDEIEYRERNSDCIRAITRKRISINTYKGIHQTSVDEDVVLVENNVEYDVKENTMDIFVQCTNETTNEVLEKTEVSANLSMDDDILLGTYEYNGVVYDLGEVMETLDESDGIQDCAITSIIVGAIIGATIGAVIGGTYSYVKFKSIKWKYVRNGAIIGTVFGGAAGWGVGFIGTKAAASSFSTVKQCSKVAKYLKSVKTLNFTKTVLGHKSRPYRNSSLLAKEIMKAATAQKDSVANCYKWVVPGSYNGTKGVWELVVNIKSNTVYHFLFKK